MSTEIVDLTKDGEPIRPAKKLKSGEGTKIHKNNDSDPKALAEEIAKSCPIHVAKSDDGPRNETVDVSLTAGWEEAKGYAGMLEECETFLDMEKKGSYAPVDEEDFDREAALEALTKTGTIDDVFQFMKKEEDDDDDEDVCHDGFWSVSCLKKTVLSKEEATEKIEGMFKGYSCMYSEGCDNFGKTPFGDPDDSENDNKRTEFSKVQESVVHILEKLKSAEYSMWDGHCQNEEYEALVERE